MEVIDTRECLPRFEFLPNRLHRATRTSVALAAACVRCPGSLCVVCVCPAPSTSDTNPPDAAARADVHLCKMYSGGLKNDWVVGESEAFQKDWSEEDMLKSAAAGGIEIKSYVFLECFNRSPADEAKWVQSMVDDPNSKCVAFCAQIYAQHGAAAVTEYLDAVKDESGALPSGLKGARMVFPASDNNAPDACLEPKFLEGLEALQAAGLHWEFCCNPTMAPNLAECCAKFPEMTFVVRGRCGCCMLHAAAALALRRRNHSHLRFRRATAVASSSSASCLTLAHAHTRTPGPARSHGDRRSITAHTTATTAVRWTCGDQLWTSSGRYRTATARWGRWKSGGWRTLVPIWTAPSPRSASTGCSMSRTVSAAAAEAFSSAEHGMVLGIQLDKTIS